MANVCRYFVETLVKAGVQRVYGVAGDSLNGLTDAIRANDTSQAPPGSFNHGTMANGMPQAIGVQASARKRQVVTLSGDDGFSMLMAAGFFFYV